jgi:hypothetical protein
VRSSLKAANDKNDDLTGRTRKVWQPRFGRDLTPDDAKKIATNITGFFSVLGEWSQAELPAPANDNGDGVTSGDEGVRNGR